VAVSFLLDGVRYAYPESPHLVLDGLTLEIPDGATVAVLGASGAGKSTLLYLLGLLWDEALASGSIAYRDGSGVEHHYGTLPREERAALRRREFGFALQSNYLLPHFSCLDNVAMPLGLGGEGLAERREAARGLIAEVGDDELRSDAVRLAHEVSGGQKQRFSVLRALIHTPRVVFADEPFSSLDEKNTASILAMLRRWREADPGRTLFLVCHDREVAFREATHFLLIGRLRRAIGGRLWGRDEFDGPDGLRDRINGGDS
jgi:putative ABC transport system ATP-binding protein